MHCRRFNKNLMLSILLIVLASTTLAAQPGEEWNRMYGGPYGCGAWSLQGTADGGYVIAGYTSILAQGSDLWLVKTDSQGFMQWNKTYGGSGEDVGCSIKHTADGGYIVVGSTRSYGMGEERLWLLKTDPKGNRQWDKIFGGFVSSSGDGGWDVDQTEDGGCIATGYTTSYGAGGKDLWLIKTDSGGNGQWSRTFGGPKNDVGMSVLQTRDRGYIVAGRTESFGQGGDDIWLLKVDSEGREQWNRTYGGPGDDVAFQVIELADGYALTGRTESNGSGKEAFLLKTDFDGNVKWMKTYGKDSSGISLKLTEDNGFIIAGSIDLQFESKKALLIKTDAYGNEQWIMPFRKSGESIGTSVTQSNDGGYVMAGMMNSFKGGEEKAWLVKVRPENVTPAFGIAPWNMTPRNINSASKLTIVVITVMRLEKLVQVNLRFWKI